jgi:hypothetical protein
VEFDLLRDSDSNIQAKRWVSPSYCNASAQYFELQRAKEEVQRLNVEIGRLLTKIRDDTLKYPAAIKKLEETDLFLAGELTRHWQYLKSVNAHHLWCFRKTCSLPGYSGPVCAGLRLGHAQPDDSAIPHASEEELQSVLRTWVVRTSRAQKRAIGCDERVLLSKERGSSYRRGLLEDRFKGSDYRRGVLVVCLSIIIRRVQLT